MKTNNEKVEKIPFKGYFKQMTEEEKRNFIFEITKYISISHFYALLRTNKFSLLHREKIEQITKLEFDWKITEETSETDEQI